MDADTKKGQPMEISRRQGLAWCLGFQSPLTAVGEPKVLEQAIIVPDITAIT
jgi:hypothetical protein